MTAVETKTRPSSHRQKGFFGLKIARALLLLLAFLFTQSATAGPISSIDRSIIAKDDTLTLKIRSFKSNSGGPDLRPLEKNFYVIGNNKSSRYVSRNGKAESWTEWVISLVPKRTGDLSIPSIRVNGEITQPLRVHVVPSVPVAAAEVKPVFLESEIDRDSAYVQQQIIYTVRIFQSVQLESMNISEPEFESAAVEKLGQTTFQRRIHNTPYRVHELRYAIFPQETGELVIPAAVFTANESVAQRSVFSLPSQGKAIRKSAKAYTITVNNPPDIFGDGLWLPAKSLKLTESWSADPDQINVGDSITRSITLLADGLLKSQLPPIKFPKLRNANFYPDQGQTESTATLEDGLRSSRVDSAAIIPTQAGELILPEIRIKWWNTDKNRVEEAILPERSLTVNAALENTQGNSTPLAVDHSGENTVKPTAEIVEADPRWKISTFIFALAWLITALLYWRKKPAPAAIESDDITVSISEKSAFKSLSRICHDNDLATIRRELIQWARSYWPQAQVQSLQDIRRLSTSLDLNNVLLQLDNQLYGRGDSGEQWNGENLLSAIKQLRSSVVKTKSAVKKPGLSPLYRSQ